MATEFLVNIGSGNGLLPDGTKPLSEPMLTYHQSGRVAFIWGHFHKRYLSHQSQATSHYLSQCWPRSMSPNGVTRPWWGFKIHLKILFNSSAWKVSRFTISRLDITSWGYKMVNINKHNTHGFNRNIITDTLYNETLVQHITMYKCTG